MCRAGSWNVLLGYVSFEQSPKHGDGLHIQKPLRTPLRYPYDPSFERALLVTDLQQLLEEDDFQGWILDGLDAII
jgi:hypothetical protein